MILWLVHRANIALCSAGAHQQQEVRGKEEVVGKNEEVKGKKSV